MTLPTRSQPLAAENLPIAREVLVAADTESHRLIRPDETVLRIVTCGSVGDGRRTLIERLSAESPTLLVEPREEHSIRHVIAGISGADLAVILVDARNGVLAPARRHSLLVYLLGIRRVVLAVDRMDLADHSQQAFEAIEAAYRAFAGTFGLTDIVAIPVSGANGDNIVEKSANTSWYAGPTLMHHLAHVEVNTTRVDPIPTADATARNADQFEATVVWMGVQPMLRGRSYLMEIGETAVTATISPLKYKLDPDALEHVPAEQLDLNEIGVCELALDRAIGFDAHGASSAARGFVLIDRPTNAAVGAGMLRFALRRDDNLHWQAVEVDRRARRALNGHGSAVVWLTGLSGAGKSTLANLLEKRLHGAGKRTYLLDGDNLRHGLNKDLGFTAADRVENIRRVAEVAKLMVDAGIIVITAFISPFRAERAMARELMAEGEFIEVFVDTPLAVAEQRDPKGLYKKARRGELKNFTGIDSPYEAPEAPDLRIDTSQVTVEAAAGAVYDRLVAAGLLDATLPVTG